MAKGSDLLVAALENEGVDRIFGVLPALSISCTGIGNRSGPSSPATSDRAAEMIQAAKRPLIMLGAAASRPRSTSGG
jgi:thiamine pyrophosphate-dependent acetolactate synthase large subunit-like protein